MRSSEIVLVFARDVQSARLPATRTAHLEKTAKRFEA
jgi:hypothetical protein